MSRDFGQRVTPEDIIGLILDEMQRSITPGWYTDFVNNVYRVYLYRDDLDALSRLENRIREQATRALDEELAKLNRPARTMPLVPAPKRKRREPLGAWQIELLENGDEDAAVNRIIVKSAAPEGIASPETLEGPPTVRVNAPPGAAEDDAKTRRTSNAGSVPVDNVVHARITYEDDTGEHQYEMSKDLIKIGRGGSNEWVDIKLLTKVDVSREHVQIRRDGRTGKFLIKDLSKLGTWMNGAQVPPSVTDDNGILRDKNVEIEMPSKARLNLANVVSVQFKKLR